MDLAIAALGSLLPKLGTLLSDEYKLHKGMRGEIKFMLAEMESMKAALNRVSMLPGHQIDDLVKIWVRDLKELSYDIEDSVDTFMLHVDASVCAEPHSFRRFFDRTVRLLTKAKTHHHIASDIKDIRRRIHEVADRRARYKFEDVIVQPDRTYIDPRLPALYEHAAKLVGIDGPSEELVNILTQRETMLQQNLMVVSIVGVGGLGKTTLANSVYERLGCKFECQAFVSVSLKPNMKKIFTSMLWQVTKDTSIDVKDKDPQDIIYGIRQFLQDKRYFIVIDDVWDESTWILIRCALTENENNLGSRVIVTTRNAEVAKLCSSCVDGTVYELDPLSEADSKRLFYKRILCDEDGVHSELEEISEKILKKCGGLPLAIITISSLLANKPKSKYEWYAVYNSIGSGLDSNKSMEHVRKILSLSYCDLPSYLKPCLLYLSIFPEDYKIDRGSLVRRWVAEGFIDGKQGRNSYEIGSSYFNELVNRSMIQPINMDASGNARACCVHDMILDLIISLSNEENFVSISNGPELITSPLCKIRRLSLQGSEKYIWEHTSVNSEEKKLVLPVTVNLSHVRSLTAFGDSFKWLPPLSMFPVLRVLDLWSKTLKDLRSLHHLRYLSLGGCLEIPEGIGNLRLLNTLHLKGLYGTIYQLPASVVQLRQLEHLLIPMDMKLPDGIGNMTSLQELSWLNVKNSPHALAELGKLTELRVLSMYGLHNKSHIKTFLHSLSSLGKINTLHFSGRGPCSVHMSDPSQVLPYLQSFDGGETTFDQLPRWFSLLSELSCLSIEVSRLRLDDLQILGALPRLCFLQLKAHLIGTTDERQVIRIKQSFHSLVEFQFMHYRTCWLIFAQRAMPKLQRLQLHFRAEQREGGGIDIGLQNLTSLKQVTINIDCEDARNREVEDMEMRFRDAVNIHLNHPILKLSRSYDYLMRED